MLLCFQCIEQVYLKAAATESSDELRSAGHNLAINMINNHIKIFYTVLSPSSTNMLTAVGLRLLAVMVTQGPSVARELLHNFNFSYKSFEALPSKAGHINKVTCVFVAVGYVGHDVTIIACCVHTIHLSIEISFKPMSLSSSY